MSGTVAGLGAGAGAAGAGAGFASAGAAVGVSTGAASAVGASGLGSSLAAALGAGAASSSPLIVAITVPTFTLSVPSATRLWPLTPSSTASTYIVALSVSISASRSPDLP